MRFLSLLVFVLFCVYMMFARWYFVCEVRHLCGEEQPVEDIRLKSLKLTEGDSTILRGYDQFAFDSASIAPRLNSDNQAFLDTLAAILRARPDRNVTITGFYRESEKDIAPGYFENIGLARADQIRKLLMKRGILQNRFSLDHGLSQDNQLREPLLFDLYDPSAIPKGFEKVVFTFRNMTFSDANFEYNSDVFLPGGPLLLYADSVKAYLGLNPAATLTIVGHTDSIGSDAYNLDLGLRRAKNAKKYFIDSLGVKATINVESMGKKRPVAPNSNPDGSDNPEGRQKNRRVNFILDNKEEAEQPQEEKILEDASDLN
ncbi:MAG: OmpA family protein [Phaeodactylibacter sp.]|nr:OmpA family protein [Phaeodactylibacter sp.]MCB9299873.1 OmpA family protein [Lewinellaceae bacterium]HQU57969.1 OmpA family protein [Saprospiraceae bacterium]